MTRACPNTLRQKQCVQASVKSWWGHDWSKMSIQEGSVSTLTKPHTTPTSTNKTLREGTRSRFRLTPLRSVSEQNLMMVYWGVHPPSLVHPSGLPAWPSDRHTIKAPPKPHASPATVLGHLQRLFPRRLFNLPRWDEQLGVQTVTHFANLHLQNTKRIKDETWLKKKKL